MNQKERLTADQIARLRDEGAALDAKADEIVARQPPGGGRSKRGIDRTMSRQVEALRRKAQGRRDRAARAETCGVRISDHAVVQYLERVYRLDLSAVYAEILPPGAADVAARLGDGDYPVETVIGTHMATVRDGTVVTTTLVRPSRF